MTSYPKDNFLPIRKKHNNFVFSAPEGMPDCSDLHVTKSEEQIMSTWKLKSVWERIKFLFKGEMTLIIWGQGMPPVALINSDAVIMGDPK